MGFEDSWLKDLDKSIALVSLTTESEPETSTLSQDSNYAPGLGNLLRVPAAMNQPMPELQSLNSSFPSERATARIELQKLQKSVEQIQGTKMESLDKVHFENIEDLRFRHCFSLL